MIKVLRDSFLNGIREIEADKALRLLGFFLCLSHVDAFVRFNDWHFLFNNSTLAPICWPEFPNCGEIRAWSTSGLQAALFVYGGLAALGAALFLRARTTRVAYGLLLLVTLFKTALILNDYRNTGNYHYMPLVATLAYLFLPNKRAVYPITVVSFYLAASALKFNAEWLTGQALWWPLPFGPRWLLTVCSSFVVFLESVLVLGLLSRVRWFAWTVFGLLTVFHLSSIYWVGFYYPTIMACLLSFFPLEWIIHRSHGRAASDFLSGRLPKIDYAFLALFAALQIYPLLLSEDSALTGQGRGFALDMFDAKAQCHYVILERSEGEAIDRALPLSDYSPRVRCDPIIYWNLVRNLCRANRATPGFKNIDIFLKARRTSDRDYRPIIDIHDACENFRINPWVNNNWLGASER